MVVNCTHVPRLTVLPLPPEQVEGPVFYSWLSESSLLCPGRRRGLRERVANRGGHPDILPFRLSAIHHEECRSLVLECFRELVSFLLGNNTIICGDVNPVLQTLAGQMF